MTIEQEEMVLRNQKLVWLVLKRFNFKNNSDDLYSIGMLGLCKGVLKFDKTKGFSESTFLYRTIFNEILQPLRRQNNKKFQEVSLNADVNFDNELTLEDVLPDEKVNIEKDFEDAELMKLLKVKLKELNECDRFIISKTFGIDCKKMNQSELAKHFKMSQSQISRIKAQALKKLEKELKDYILNY